ncbi:retrovirus-related Pol polyprotein LINE-1 [Elysia marginata]|uniref:Retrovirus-related Pol polyprotein LINE-1 n=1 Tax=Elysia marginata TaxID=1093978 RepID=A0AAV4J7W5_9GAST|nr:retrovirus-related Pol polyprotein LINE-1 [Elysia marginata]
MIMSIFLYESWILNADTERRIRAMKMRYYGISYKEHITNEEVRRRIENAIGSHVDLLTIVRQRTLKWYGHTTRSSGLAKTIMQGTVNGGRRRGRQKKRWEDIKEWTGLELRNTPRKAEDREEWIERRRKKKSLSVRTPREIERSRFKLSRLDVYEKVRAAAQAISRGDLQELKTLAAPPQGVKDTLEAVQFLLGRPAHVATDYKKALKLLSGVGKESLTQQILDRDVQQVDPSAALRAKDVIKSHSLQDITNKSKASVAIFRWATAMIEAVESRGETHTATPQGK